MTPEKRPFSARGKLLLALAAALIVAVPVLVLLRSPPPLAPPQPTPTSTFVLIEDAIDLLPTPVPVTPEPTVTPVPTPPPTPVVMPKPTKVVTLRRNDEGDAVRELQRRLAALGYLLESDVDGDFGKGTEAAVKAFQQLNGLKADGVAGSATLTALFGPAPVPAQQLR